MHAFTEKEQLHTFARNAQMPLCTLDASLRITWASSEFYTLLRCDERQCHMMRLDKLLFSNAQPDGAFMALWNQAYTAPLAAADFECQPDGVHKLFLSAHIFQQAETEGFIVAFNNRSAYLKAERELSALRDEHEDFFQHSEIPMCYNDLSGTFIKANKAFCKLFECDCSQMEGRDFMELPFDTYTIEEKLKMRREAVDALRDVQVFRKTVEISNRLSEEKGMFEVVMRKSILGGKPVIAVYLLPLKASNHLQEINNDTNTINTMLRKPLANVLGLLEIARSEALGAAKVSLDKETLSRLSDQISEILNQLSDHRAEVQSYPEVLPSRVDHVWIVDDDQVITYITEHMLLNADSTLKISSFLSAKMALEKLRIDGVAPDILLLDINMPGITGWEFLDQLNALGLQANVYMYSSSIDPDDVKEARNYPMVKDFINKPLDARTIRQVLAIGGEQRKVS
jgi:CheY-like chemotaxis protein/PAS domain-containing protein